MFKSQFCFLIYQNVEELKQTCPPSIAIKDLFPDGNYPEGEIQEHPTTHDGRTGKDRMSNEEKKAIDRMNEDIYKEARLAAEAHRHTRQYMKEYIKPGMTMIEIWYVNIGLIIMLVKVYYFLFQRSRLFIL